MDLRTDNMLIDNTREKKYNKYCKLLVVLCIFIYGIMTCSKNLLSAEIIEITEVFKTSSARANMANSFYYVTYAFMQILIVFFLDKVNLRNFIFITLFPSAILTAVTGTVGNLSGNIVYIWIIYAVNGILQAGCYSICIKIFSIYLSREMLPTANKILSSTTVIVNVITFGVAALFVHFDRWDLPFLILGLLFLFSIIVFYFLYKEITDRITENKPDDLVESATQEKNDISTVLVIKNKSDITFAYIFLSVLTFLTNALYFSLFNWFSKLLYDVFSLSKTYSIFISLFIPLITFLGSIISINICEKHNAIYVVAIIMYGISLPLSFLLVLFYDINIFFVVVIYVGFLIIANGARNIYQSITAFKLRTVIDSGKLSLVLNGTASIGAGFAPTIIGWVIDCYGWMSSFLLLFLLDGLIFILTIILVVTENNKYKNYSYSR